MTFSMISAPGAYESHISSDHAFQAWEAIRRAQRVRWDAANAQRWRAEFKRHIAEARNRVVAHHETSRAPESPITRVVAASGGETRMVREHLAEHRWLRERLTELLHAVEARSAATLEDVVELTEQAIFLEIQLARHQNRFRSLLHHARSLTDGNVATVARPSLR